MNHSDAWYANQLAHCDAALAQIDRTPTADEVEAARARLDAHARQERAQGGLDLGVAA